MAQKKGNLIYTETAFEQDAGQAMKNDIVRALIELITNCDDAYARAKTTGKIQIIVNRWTNKDEHLTISVRDHATGLEPTKMEENFTVLGADKSGFAEGEEVRGLFSRGSKDTAWFGQTIIESVHGSSYSRITLLSSGVWEFDSNLATEEDRKKLGLSDGQNGLSATIVITRGDTRVPDLRALVDKLANHIQLRRIVQRQEVTISEFVDQKLVQAPKIVWSEPKSTPLLDKVVAVPGYDCTARLVINRLEERSEGPVNEFSRHGIEIRGRRAGYMNTMFGQTGFGIALISGSLDCPTIDDLIRSFGKSKGADVKNPMRLVSRSRDGLEETHPFMRALTVAVLEELKPILASLEPKMSETGSPELRKDLNTFAKLLAEEMKSDLDDEGDFGRWAKAPSSENPIIVIPPVRRIRKGARGTLTVLVREGSAAADGLEVSLSNGVAKAVGQPTEMERHASFGETRVSQIRLMGLETGSGTVVVSAKKRPAECATAEVVVHEGFTDEEEPESLEWSNPEMSVSVGKTRSLLLRAPIGVSENGELNVSVSISGNEVQLEDHRCLLKLTTKGWLEGRVRVTGIGLTSRALKIVAQGGGVSASGLISTSVPGPLGGLNIETEIVDEFAGPLRGRVSKDESGLKFILFGRHKALASRLGALKSDNTYTRDTELDTLVMIAEIMSSLASDHVLMHKVSSDPTILQDIDKVLYEKTKLVDRYLRIILEGLRGTPKVS